MPVYEYVCGDCGDFTATRAMAQCGEPHPCPFCGEEAPRAFVTAPAFAGLPAAVRRAHAVNERSAHEPRNASGHGAGCACCSTGKSSAVRGSDGSKAFPRKRPWMISH